MTETVFTQDMTTPEHNHTTRVSIQNGEYVVICDICNVVGRPETFEGDAQAIADRHQEIGGFG